MATISELLGLKGRRALITGAGGNLGKIIADTLGELGADLVLVDRPGSGLESQAEILGRRWGGDVLCRYCDLEDQGQRTDLVMGLVQSGASVDILVNNAAFVGTSGLQGWVGPFEEQSVETWRRAMEVNLTAAFHLSQLLIPLLQARGKGVILNIGSIYGVVGPDMRLYENLSMGNPAAYAASKGGLIQLTRWLATVLAPDIRVNCISPGGIFRNQPDAFVERYVARTPLRRMATEDDFRGGIAYLASDLSSYVTGENLMVDGGWAVW